MGIQIQALLDTGSHATCISQIMFDRLENHNNENKSKYLWKVMPVSNLAITAAFGKRICKIKKQVYVDINIDGRNLETILLVVPGLAYDVILGTDWLEEYAVIINYQNKSITLKDREICSPRVSFDSQLPRVAYDLDTVTVNNGIHLIESAQSADLNESLLSDNSEDRFECILSDGYFDDSDGKQLSYIRINAIHKVVEQVNGIESLSESEKKQLIEVIDEFPDVFSDELGALRHFKLKLELSDSHPSIRTSYQIPIAYKPGVLKELKRLEEAKVIKKAATPFCNPIRVVPKKDNSVRLCLDARRLNKYLINDNEGPPPIESLLQKHHGKTIFTIMDLLKGYHQIKLSEESMKYTGFVIEGQSYVFCRMPFGLKISGAIFIRAMNAVFDESFAEIVTIYVDDILLASKDVQQHFHDLRRVCRRLREVGLTVNLEKTTFCRREVPFLGFILTPQGVKADPEKLKALQNIPEPTSRLELQRVLGIFGYYRRFVVAYSTYLDSFRDLLNTKNRFQWTDYHSSEFRRLKESFIKVVALDNYLPNREFRMQTDASKKGISAILYQIDDQGDERIISVISRCLTSCEINYTATEIELLAIIVALIRFRMYLLGTFFHIITDHAALTFMIKTPYHNSRLIRWSLFLQEYSFDIRHCSGRDNLVADYFSRIMPDVYLNEHAADVIVSVLARYRDELAESSNTTELMVGSINKIDIPELGHIKSWQQKDQQIRDTIDEVNRKNLTEPYCVRDDVLYYKKRNDKTWKLVVPKELRKNLIDEVHERMGHLGAYKTYAELSRTYYWPGIQSDVKKRVVACDLCQRVKTQNFTMEGSYMHVRAKKPNELLCIDFYGPLPRSTAGVQYILVILDAFSRFVTLYPMVKATARMTTIKLAKYFETHGVPKRILSDHGTQFTSHQYGAFLLENGVEKVLCSIRHPQSNPSERVMRELGRFFRTYCSEQHTRWARYINKIMDWVNLSVNCTTRYTPFELQYGKSQKDKIREILNFPPEIAETPEIKIEIAREKIDKVCKKRREKQSSFNDTPIHEGDLVLLRIPHRSDKEDRVISKFFHIYHGPYKVHRVINRNAYELAERDDPLEIKGVYNRIDFKIYKTQSD